MGYCLLLSWFFGFAIIVGINSGCLYHLCVLGLHLNQQFHVSTRVLMDNFHQMVTYIQFPWKNQMNLHFYRLSPAAQSHFYDVKQLVEKIELVFLLLSSWLAWACFKQKIYRQIWRLESLLDVTMIVIGVISFFLLLDFQDCFIYFHRLIFQRQTWIFNPQIDPIINVLPDQYFGAAFALVVVTFLGGLLSLRLVGYYQLKKTSS
ncbi:TIGR01906 family membrane protein [Fructilactobacillus hinvesii]|uniref:TIGR01906 family membrane protein n=2 Tax=Fructilactobacillus hinvesii TaxID=2940300 RepID=A0ABY5BUT3_9LACO|nr:TIGR01906 family membrane protein [Fructilactobacillus hinvesii]USS88604.1 TIGR01906 family membrane protein [Fructilactobacillus hinvesii]